ncbi:MAG: hypothetical protein OEL54_02580, partial [Flavobacteriaceae bacterium]|nr:hypothetical protein [Flavobacteriaceae bacterium]
YKCLCIRCGKIVESGKGVIGRTRNVFAVRHIECMQKDQEEILTVKKVSDLPMCDEAYKRKWGG